MAARGLAIVTPVILGAVLSGEAAAGSQTPPAHQEKPPAAGARGFSDIDGPPPPAAPAMINRDERGKATMRAVRIDRAIHLDGRLDDDAYSSIPAVSGFIQQFPRAATPIGLLNRSLAFKVTRLLRF